MNHRPPVSLTVTKAIEGFFNYKIAEGLSDRTVESYQCQLQKWREYMGEDKDVARITTSELTAYLNWLRNDYVPHSFGSPKERLSALQNVLKSVYDRKLFGSCFIERCLKPGLTHSLYRKGIPLGQAYLSAELAVVLFKNIMPVGIQQLLQVDGRIQIAVYHLATVLTGIHPFGQTDRSLVPTLRTPFR